MMEKISLAYVTSKIDQPTQTGTPFVSIGDDTNPLDGLEMTSSKPKVRALFKRLVRQGRVPFKLMIHCAAILHTRAD